MHFKRLSTVAAALLALTLTACGSTSPADSSSESGSAAGKANSWPRSISHDLGTAKIDKQPVNIVSTSVVLTGALLSIGAPVKGSGASLPNAVGLDSQGFFTQWSAEAQKAGVKALYTKSELDLEAVTAANPDLIIMSTTGGDSTKDQYAQLNAIAPTVSIDYNSASWQSVITELGKVTGHEQEAVDRLAKYDQEITALKATMTPPAAPVQPIVFNPDNGSAFALPDGPHSGVLSGLGLKVAPLPDGVTPREGRGDMAFASAEQSVAGLTAEDVLLIDGDEKTVAAFKSTNGYKATKAATSGRVIPLGHPSFKLDYYSALDMAKAVAAAYQS